MEPKIIAIVPAAGVGLRAQTNPEGRARSVPKQYQPIGGDAMLRRSVQALLHEPRIHQVRVIVSPTDTWAAACLADLPRTVWRDCGGATRADTVRQGLADAQLTDQDWVLVHDAARPGLPLADLQRLLETCLAQQQGGLLALPVADTVKQQDHHTPSRVAKTIDREGLWLAQTPQCFPASLLQQALQHCVEQDIPTTDEASAVETLGHTPLLVRGSMRNFKVTWPEDFLLMEKWLAL